MHCAMLCFRLIGLVTSVQPPLNYCLSCVFRCYAREPYCAATSTWDILAELFPEPQGQRPFLDGLRDQTP